MAFTSIEELDKSHEIEMVSRVSKYLSNIGYKNFNPNSLWILEEPILEKLRGNSKRTYQKLTSL